MTVREQQMILDAYDRGEEIEWRSINVAEWSRIPPKDQFKEGGYDEPLFDFIHNYYRVKPKRWRAPLRFHYFYFTATGEVILATEDNHVVDTERYDAGNYFQTKEEALRAADYTKKCLIEFHESN